jgi:hypothetical protein
VARKADITLHLEKGALVEAGRLEGAIAGGAA